MNTQSQQQAAPAESGQAPVNQQGQFPQSPYAGGYAQARPGNRRDGNTPGLPHLFGGLHLQQQRQGPKFNMKGHMGMPPNAVYSNQFFGMPNGPMFGNMPQVPPFGPAPVPGHDQAGQMPYLPGNVYPNMNPGCSMVAGPMQGYPWPYMMNYDMQDQKKGPWMSTDEQKPSTSSGNESGNQTDYYQGSGVSTMDTSSFSGYGPNFPAQLAQPGLPILPLQMMKTASGYILQDLEVLTQQDPPIPRAVPAMWTNPSDMTLAKCLENREGITNVYVRGFLPETTDEMLYAYASRFGKIDRCKAIVDLDTGLCKG